MEINDINSLSPLSGRYYLNKDQKKSYVKNGCILINSLAGSEEVEEYLPYINRVMGRLSNESRPVGERYVYGKALLQGMNLWRRSEEIKRFVFSTRFAQVAAELMGVDRVRLKHDCALFKEPGAEPTPTHQDQRVWPIDTNKTITMWMPLINITNSMGSMTFYPGSQEWRELNLSPEKLRMKAVRAGLPSINYGDMRAGDATFHNGWLLHGAPSNVSKKTRAVMTIIYYEDNARVIETAGDNIREKHLKRYFPGLKTGDIAVTSLNPIIYDKMDWSKEGRG